MRILLLCCVVATAAAQMACASGFQEFNAGLAAGNRNDLDGAVSALSRALVAPDLPQDLRATAYVARGEAYGIQKRYDAALSDFMDASRLRPSSPRILLDRAELYEQVDRYADALADETSVIHLRPYYFPAYYMRISTYEALGRYEDAISDCNRLLTDWPQDKASILASRADVYLHAGQYEQADDDADGAIAANSKMPNGYIVRGRVHALTDALDKAQDDFGYALDDDGSSADALNDRGLVAWDLGKFDSASADFDAALKHDEVISMLCSALKSLISKRAHTPTVGLPPPARHSI